jgi:predicted lipoprotein with Yx(FWY)xxD motif
LVLAVAVAALVAACGGSSGGNGSSSGSNGSASNVGASTGYGSYGASASSSSSTTASAASNATVKLARTAKGRLLVNSRGFTLYMFTADRRQTDRCVKVRGCTAPWPPLTVKTRATAGSGLSRSLLATIKLPNGRHQVTYAGRPLYGYTGDGSPASTGYIGITSFGGTWLGVNAAGKPVR